MMKTLRLTYHVNDSFISVTKVIEILDRKIKNTHKLQWETVKIAFGIYQTKGIDDQYFFL